MPHAHTRLTQRQYRTWKRNFRVIETSVHAYFVILLFIFTINNYNSGPFYYCFLLICKSHKFNFICKIFSVSQKKEFGWQLIVYDMQPFSVTDRSSILYGQMDQIFKLFNHRLFI